MVAQTPDPMKRPFSPSPLSNFSGSRAPTADEIQRQKDEEEYNDLELIRHLKDEYFASTNRIGIKQQTGYARFDLLRQRNNNTFNNRQDAAEEVESTKRRLLEERVKAAQAFERERLEREQRSMEELKEAEERYNSFQAHWDRKRDIEYWHQVEEDRIRAEREHAQQKQNHLDFLHRSRVSALERDEREERKTNRKMYWLDMCRMGFRAINLNEKAHREGIAEERIASLAKLSLLLRQTVDDQTAKDRELYEAEQAALERAERAERKQKEALFTVAKWEITKDEERTREEELVKGFLRGYRAIMKLVKTTHQELVARLGAEMQQLSTSVETEARFEIKAQEVAAWVALREDYEEASTLIMLEQKVKKITRARVRRSSTDGISSSAPTTPAPGAAGANQRLKRRQSLYVKKAGLGSFQFD